MTETTASGRAGPAARDRRARVPAERDPVARVVVDIPLSHLDRPFDYLVPHRLDAVAVPGCRVRVRFAGQLVDGYLLDRAAASDFPGRLALIDRVVSAEPVLTPEVHALAEEVARRYAGTLADVLRLAIPPRHARTEAEPPAPAAAPPGAPEPGAWADYPGGARFLAALQHGHAPRAVWSALPGPSAGAGWPEAIATAVRAGLAGGRGALVVVPDARDVARVDAALGAALGPGQHVVLAAGTGPAARYRSWLAVRRGAVRAVVGTRAAMFAPVAALGLVVIWDDGDDVHLDPRAPYPHAREVLLLRAHRCGAAALVAGFTVTAEGAALIASGWARPLVADRAVLRDRAPRVLAAGDDAELADDAAARVARLPSLAWRTARAALGHGPVLVQVPRRGYLPALGCARCRAAARCAGCAGPLALRAQHSAPYCRWCARSAAQWRCPRCGHPRVRAVVVGARRTAEELGRAFPGVAVRTSGRDGVVDRVGAEPGLVVATPGAEPVAAEGYAAALLLDGWALLGRPDLRAAEEALRRWINAAALVRPARAGGRVVVLAEAALPPVQALIRWDPGGYAERELAERAELGFPPAVRMASLTGSPTALHELLTLARLPEPAEVLGPVPVPGDDSGETERVLVRVPKAVGTALARALHAAQGVRSAAKAADPVRVRIDPLDLV